MSPKLNVQKWYDKYFFQFNYSLRMFFFLNLETQKYIFKVRLVKNNIKNDQ